MMLTCMDCGTELERGEQATTIVIRRLWYQTDPDDATVPTYVLHVCMVCEESRRKVPANHPFTEDGFQRPGACQS